eukprot:COSAG06_NODE_1425_length_9497_cov_8.974463_2_plen_276_part_00
MLLGLSSLPLQLKGPIRKAHSDLNALSREAQAKTAEADRVLEQVAKDSVGPSRGIGQGLRNSRTSTQPVSSQDSSAPQNPDARPALGTTGSTAPRAEADGTNIKSRPTSRDSHTSTPRSLGRAGGSHGGFSAPGIAPPNLESLNGVQRLGVRKPISRGSPRTAAGNDGGVQKEGSQWIQQSVDQFKQFAQLNKDITRLWKTAVKVDLVSLPDDPRLHSTMGRQNYEQDRAAWLNEQSGEGKIRSDDSHTVGVAINSFAGLFAEEQPVEDREFESP